MVIRDKRSSTLASIVALEFLYSGVVPLLGSDTACTVANRSEIHRGIEGSIFTQRLEELKGPKVANVLRTEEAPPDHIYPTLGLTDCRHSKGFVMEWKQLLRTARVFVHTSLDVFGTGNCSSLCKNHIPAHVLSAISRTRPQPADVPSRLLGTSAYRRTGPSSP
jgi:hypothetical protein